MITKVTHDVGNKTTTIKWEGEESLKSLAKEFYHTQYNISRKVHMQNKMGESLCGYGNKTGIEITVNKDEVNCKQCFKILELMTELKPLFEKEK